MRCLIQVIEITNDQLLCPDVYTISVSERVMSCASLRGCRLITNASARTHARSAYSTSICHAGLNTGLTMRCGVLQEVQQLQDKIKGKGEAHDGVGCLFQLIYSDLDRGNVEGQKRGKISFYLTVPLCLNTLRRNCRDFHPVLFSDTNDLSHSHPVVLSA